MASVASSFSFKNATIDETTSGLPAVPNASGALLNTHNTATTGSGFSDSMFSTLNSQPTGATSPSSPSSTSISPGLKPQTTGFSGLKAFKPSSSFGASLLESLPPITMPNSNSTGTAGGASPAAAVEPRRDDLFWRCCLWAELTANKDELSTNRCTVVWRVWRRVNSGRWSSAADDRSRESILFVNVHRLHGRSDECNYGSILQLNFFAFCVHWCCWKLQCGIICVQWHAFRRFWVRSEPFSFFSCGNMDSSGTVDKTMSRTKTSAKTSLWLLLDWGLRRPLNLPSQKIRLILLRLKVLMRLVAW